MNWLSAREGVQIALDALRSNKVRAALTVLGIVIGVATVVAMAAMIVGIRSSVVGQLEAMGPKNFVVDRWDQTALTFHGPGEDPPWEGKPAITLDEADLLRSLPSIGAVAAAIDTRADVRHESSSLSNIMVAGRGYQWPDYLEGDFLAGRNFLPTDDRRGAAMAVLSEGLADGLFEGANPVGEQIRIGGELFVVTGVYRQVDNLFSGVMENWAVVPATTALKRLDVNSDWVQLLVVPTGAASQDRAMDDVTAALRSTRGLGPGEDNNFALMRQEAFLELFDNITGVFFLVMLVLSSIGLMVGGVGVVAIMMISVTERTREIGVRKALGATRREILFQFLVESMTVTVIGGIIGLVLGSAVAFLLAAFTPIPASIPLWAVFAALGVSAVTGIGFGMYPANKASRLDPVEALRHE
jgi:putative ABC transport system permease protein